MVGEGEVYPSVSHLRAVEAPLQRYELEEVALLVWTEVVLVATGGLATRRSGALAHSLEAEGGLAAPIAVPSEAAPKLAQEGPGLLPVVQPVKEVQTLFRGQLAAQCFAAAMSDVPEPVVLAGAMLREMGPRHH